jgi:hypothetical protein
MKIRRIFKLTQFISHIRELKETKTATKQQRKTVKKIYKHKTPSTFFCRLKYKFYIFFILQSPQNLI